MRQSLAHDPELHADGTPGAAGRCSHHESCTAEAVVSFQDAEGDWQSGCAAALEELVAAGEIEPLGQGA